MHSLGFSVAVAVIATAVSGTAGVAHAENNLCAQRKVYRGTPIDFDMKDADVHDVYRMLAEVGRVNVVVADSVRGKVTMKLRRVPWDQVACTVAAVHRLTVTLDGNVLLVRQQAAAADRAAHLADPR